MTSDTSKPSDTTPIIPTYPPAEPPTPNVDQEPPEQQAEPICTPAQDANNNCPKPT